MIDPSSSEEEGDEEPVVNLPSKGRIGATHKTGTPGVGAPPPSQPAITSTSGPNNFQNGEFQVNQRPSSFTASNSRFDGSNVGGGGGGGVGAGSIQSKNEQPQPGIDGGSLEVPNNGIPRFVSA